ncbi:MAG TPA: N-6 DNA methylase [Thermoleophilaceae bacterium]|nr:N-6 DNA methylase [Thermoleophilaceae bacterium]
MDERRRLGQYMTPDAVADDLVAMLEGSPRDWRILDPACGDGNLLLAAARALRRVGVPDVVERLVGIDIDPAMVELARNRLATHLGCAVGDTRVRRADFLESDLPPGVTAIVANPPYGKRREYEFFERARLLAEPGTELAFLLPLSFLDRAEGVFSSHALSGRPLGVTTGHALVHHVAGAPFALRPTRRAAASAHPFEVLTGIKLYEVGAGVPPQTAEVLTSKPFSGSTPRKGWLPCVRTGDIDPPSLRVDRLWVRYGDHLAHPKTIERFVGPKLFVRRVPLWNGRRLGAVYSEDLVLCAGDVLVVRHQSDDAAELERLARWLNSPTAAARIHEMRPSVFLRDSFPKIAAKDLGALIAGRDQALEQPVAA